MRLIPAGASDARTYDGAFDVVAQLAVLVALDFVHVGVVFGGGFEAVRAGRIAVVFLQEGVDG